MLISKSYTYQSLRVKPLEISYSSVNFFSDRDEDLLVSKEFVLTKDLGICQCGLPTSEKHDSPEEFESSNFRPLLCYAPAVPKYLPTLVIASIPSSEDFERKSSSEENPNPNTYKPKVIEHH